MKEEKKKKKGTKNLFTLKPNFVEGGIKVSKRFILNSGGTPNRFLIHKEKEHTMRTGSTTGGTSSSFVSRRREFYATTTTSSSSKMMMMHVMNMERRSGLKKGGDKMTHQRRRLEKTTTTSAFFSSPAPPAEEEEEKEEGDFVTSSSKNSLSVTVENPSPSSSMSKNSRKNQCTKVFVEGPNRRGELASIASSLTSYGVDIIFAEAEAIGCVVDYYYDAASVSTKKKKNGSVASNESTTTTTRSPSSSSSQEEEEEEEEISCAKNIFWVQLNDKMLDETQQEDLRAFLQDSLLPENNPTIDGETSTTQTTEDLFKKYTPELTPEKLSGTYVGTTEKVLAKNKEQLSTMPNIYGQAAMSELKLLRKKPNARQLLSSEARKESEAVVRSAQQLELAAAELAASAAALVSIERKSAQLECDMFDEEGKILSKEAEEECMKVDEGRSDLRALFERRMAAMEAALATRDRVRDSMRKPFGANGEKSKNAYEDAAAAAALRPPDSPSITVDADFLASEAFQKFAEETDTVVPYLDDLDLRRTRAQRISPTKELKEALVDKRLIDVRENAVKEEELTVTQPPLFSPLARPLPSTPCGNGKEIILQGFNWESCRSGEKFSQTWYDRIIEESSDIARAGFTAVWMPPPTTSVSKEGYMPTDFYNLNTFYGSEEELKECVKTLNEKSITAVADIVINHRCATQQDEQGRWNIYEGKLAWDQSAICSGNPAFGGTGNPKTGEDYGPAPNIDHRNESIRNDIKEWLNYLRDEIGFRGWRFDFVKGYNGVYSGEYVEATRPFLAFGEFWDTCSYTDGILEYDQRNHRQRTCNWVDASGGNTAAFDFTTKGVLQEACAKGEYWRLMDPDGRPPGLCGIWPSRAVLFLENHDTGSTLQHWPFPSHKLEEGYAYILTHPGTPTIFYDHWTAKETVMVDGTQAANGQLRECIETLIKIRKRVGISSRSAIQIMDSINAAKGYAARIGARRNVNSTNKVTEGASSDLDPDEPSICMKIGYDEWSPNQTQVGGREWKCVASGEGWAVWEDKAFMSEEDAL